MTIEYCSECNEATGNAGRGEGSVFVIRNNEEIGPLCDECCSGYLCGQCGEIAMELQEGYCEDCCNQNQVQLDENNRSYDRWNNLTDDERNNEIKERIK